MTQSFIVDDFDAAREFIRNLPPKIKRERFSLDIITNESTHWTPTHIVLAVADNRIVAMADALYADNGTAANGSLVALRGFGGHAVRAHLHLKKIFPAGYWEACLRDPTAATMAISRKFFDAAYDQGAWEVQQELMRRYGPDLPFGLAPILANDSLLKRFGLPRIPKMSTTLKREIVASAITMSPSNLPIIFGQMLDAQSMLALSFDIVDAPYKVRQYVTRFLIVGMGAIVGQIGDPAVVKRIVKPRYFEKFLDRLRKYIDENPALD